jgi:hypothetical protein
MRSRVSPKLGTTSAAGATAVLLSLAMTGAAGAAGPRTGTLTPSGGTPIVTNTNCTLSVPPMPSDNCAEAGYQASGRDFRYAQALIRVPEYPGTILAGPSRGGVRRTPILVAGPQFYVALDGSGTATYQFARAGITACGLPPAPPAAPHGIRSTCGTSGWEAYAQVNLVAPPGAPPRTVGFAAFPIAAAEEGDGVFVSVYLEPTGHSVRTVITLPDGSTYDNTFPAPGAVYPRAQALADWTLAPGKPQPVPPTAKLRDTQFLQGRFTTANGQRGTFAGPWSLTALEGTTGGQLPSAGGTLVVQPGYLWTDGGSPGGMPGDAFGVWRFPS